MKRTLVLVTLLAGCSFPEIDAVVPEDAVIDSGVEESSSGDAEADSSLEDSSIVDSTGDDSSTAEDADATTADGAEASAPDSAADADAAPKDSGTDTSVDSGTKPDSASDGPDVGVCETGMLCDCDGDGDNKIGPGCSGMDCDDGDSRRNSKVTMYQSYDATGTTHKGDWNCSGVVETEFKPGISCGGLAVGGTACSGAEGYKEATVACGKTATYVHCKVSTAILCVEDTTKTATITVKCK
ncbi:MAG: hypothetical protein ACXWUG_10980 [Polyangiales bacterium]